MRHFILFAIVAYLSSISPTYGQSATNLRFNEVSKEINDSNSTNFYPKLIERFLRHDTTLTEKENTLIYYGNYFYQNYSPYSRHRKEDKFLKYYFAENYNKAIPIGKKIIQDNPVNIKVLLKLLVSYYQIGDTLNTDLYADMYFDLIEVILNSGDGNSITTAYVVINVSDEYEVLKYFELESKGQVLSVETDILTIDTVNQKTISGKEKIEKLYFNVGYPNSYITYELLKNRKKRQ